MIKNLTTFNEMYFNSLNDFLSVNEITDTFNFTIVESDDDINSIADYLNQLFNSIPDSFFKNFKLSPDNLVTNSHQLSFGSFDIINKIKAFIDTKKASFFSTLLVLACFDFSFINYIFPENPNFSTQASSFKKSSDQVSSTYYSNISLFKACILKHLESITSDRKLEKFLYNHSDIAIACGFDPLVIPDHSVLNRFKSNKLTPLNLVAIFYFILIVIISHQLVDSFVCSTDSTHVFSRANKYNRIPLSDGLHFYNTHSDINANVGHKTKDFDFFGYKVHTAVDSVSRFILGFFLTPGSSNDSPLFIPLQKFIHKIVSCKFSVYACDKGYDSSTNNDFIVDELSASPAIPVRNMTTKSNSEHFTLINNIPHCKYTGLPLMKNGTDKKANCQLWNCPNSSKKFQCPCLDLCNPTSKNQTRTFKTYFSDVRKNGTADLPKASPQWKKAYNKRVIIEQIFSELKVSFGLNDLTQFKLSSIFAHIALSMITYNLSLFVLK